MRAERETVVITIRDEGSGIPADFLPRIFEPFVQSNETLDRSEGGLGVGLTLVKSLVEMHGGSIEAFSDGRDRGSTFVVKLPRTHLRPSPNPPTETEPSTSLTDASNKQVDKKVCRIVLIEDIDDNREILKAILELDGHEVICAGNGESGCDAILQHLPHVALVDIGLPG